MRTFIAILVAGTLAGGLAPAAAQTAVPIIFVHHSVGRNLLQEGAIREELSQLGAARGLDLRLWDHDYNDIGLTDPQGQTLGYSFQIPGDDTDPDGWHDIWTTGNATRDSLLSRFTVIAFKSCYTASAITSDAQLADYQRWYGEMAQVFDAHPDRLFVVLSPPPRHRLATDLDDADRARAFADWLGSPAFLAGHPNVAFFDLFDQLAHPDDGSDVRNMLRYDYERSHTDGDSHPNVTANATVGPRLAAFLADLAVLVPAAGRSWGEIKASYR